MDAPCLRSRHELLDLEVRIWHHSKRKQGARHQYVPLRASRKQDCGKNTYMQESAPADGWTDILAMVPQFHVGESARQRRREESALVLDDVKMAHCLETIMA